MQRFRLFLLINFQGQKCCKGHLGQTAQNRQWSSIWCRRNLSKEWGYFSQSVIRQWFSNKIERVEPVEVGKGIFAYPTRITLLRRGSSPYNILSFFFFYFLILPVLPSLDWKRSTWDPQLPRMNRDKWRGMTIGSCLRWGTWPMILEHVELEILGLLWASSPCHLSVGLK